MDFFSLETILIMVPILLIALPFHELAHAWVAYKLGDNTAKERGRLTLNPFKHLDLIGTIMMFVVGVGWAKPVPVNSNNFKQPRKGMVLVSVAGPLSNLILAFISTFISGIVAKLLVTGIIPLTTRFSVQLTSFVSLFFYILVIVNLNLAFFNLIPVPPLDGSRLLTSFIPEKSYEIFTRIEPFIGLAFLALVVLFPDNILGDILKAVTEPLRRSMAFVTQAILGINSNNPFWLIMQGQV